jgi:hypothetical protein
MPAFCAASPAAHLCHVCINLLPHASNVVLQRLHLCVDFVYIVKQRVVGILSSIECSNQLVNVLDACSAATYVAGQR